MTRPWTKFELDLIREHYPSGGSMKVREFLPHRSRSAVNNKAFGMKLAHGSGRGKRGGSGDWHITPDEIARRAAAVRSERV